MLKEIKLDKCLNTNVGTYLLDTCMHIGYESLKMENYIGEAARKEKLLFFV